MHQTKLVAMFVAALGAALGCASASAERPAADPSAQSVTREDAIASARKDAYFHFGEVSPSDVQIMQQGGFWIVELSRPGGGALHYAISARDGSIRQRSSVQ